MLRASRRCRRPRVTNILAGASRIFVTLQESSGTGRRSALPTVNYYYTRGGVTKQFCATFFVSGQRSADACSCSGSVVSRQWAPMPSHAVCRCCPQTHPFRPWIPSCTRTAHPSRPCPPAHGRGLEWKCEEKISAGQPEVNADCNSMLVIR